MSNLKRKDIVPGTVLKVKLNKTLSMDAHLILFGKSWELLPNNPFTILTKPRRKDGINLVKVKMYGGQEYECYYCDVLKNCEY